MCSARRCYGVRCRHGLQLQKVSGPDEKLQALMKNYRLLKTCKMSLDDISHANSPSQAALN